MFLLIKTQHFINIKKSASSKQQVKMKTELCHLPVENVIEIDEFPQNILVSIKLYCLQTLLLARLLTGNLPKLGLFQKLFLLHK